MYNRILPYGDRAYGKTVTVINRSAYFFPVRHFPLLSSSWNYRSEVVGRPLAALLSNDGARVFSVDIDSIQEYNKRPQASSDSTRYNPRHIVHPCTMSLQEVLAISDVVVSAVPSANYKVKTEWLKAGCICLNVAADKNFEKDVRDKVRIAVSWTLLSC